MRRPMRRWSRALALVPVLFLVLVPRKTAPAQLRTIARVNPGRMRHHGRDRRGTPRDVRVG